MLQTNQVPSVGLIIQESGEGVTLTLSGFKGVALCLSVQQARAFASDLIQHAHRIEVKHSLKKAKFRASQPALERTGVASITPLLRQA